MFSCFSFLPFRGDQEPDSQLAVLRVWPTAHCPPTPPAQWAPALLGLWAEQISGQTKPHSLHALEAATWLLTLRQLLPRGQPAAGCARLLHTLLTLRLPAQVSLPGTRRPQTQDSAPRRRASGGHSEDPSHLSNPWQVHHADLSPSPAGVRPHEPRAVLGKQPVPSRCSAPSGRDG